MATRWIFFDVGNVLFNDAPQDFEAFRIFHRAIQAVDPTCSFVSLLGERERLARSGEPRVLATLAARWLESDQIRSAYFDARRMVFSRYDEFNLVNDGLHEVLERLARRYRLGVIANQPPECRPSLVRRGLAGLFDVVAVSEELGLHKPGAEIFQWALARAGARPEECVMVGDRLDNDVAPAARLGMRTVWLHWPNHRWKNWFPADPEAAAFLESTDRVPYYGAARGAADEATATARTLRGVPDAVESIAIE